MVSAQIYLQVRIMGVVALKKIKAEILLRPAGTESRWRMGQDTALQSWEPLFLGNEVLKLSSFIL